MIELETTIESAEGAMGTYLVRPDGDGPWPVVLFLMDAPGKRPLLHSMAERVASNGYYVMLPNLYYRVTDSFQLDFSSSGSLARMKELMFKVGNNMAARDASSLLDYADADPAADADVVGCVGYCMSGPFALTVAAVHADRVRAAASIYGTRLLVDAKDSPHRRLGEIKGEIYVACAEHDDYVPPPMVDQFEAAMREAGVTGRLERYPGTHHGFAFDDRPAYDAEADERHWSALLDLFDRNLKGMDR